MSIDALRQAAGTGNADAQLQLGIALMTGQGVPAQDAEQGRAWLEKAADNQNRDAQRFIGMIYLRGMDVVPDPGKGAAYLERAAQRGDHEATWLLASFLGGSRDERHEPAKAHRLLRQAARAGHPRAQAHLGYCFQRGLYEPADPRQALRWFIRAAGAGDPGALLALAEFSRAGLLVPRDRDRAYWLARTAAGKDWLVAGEVAAELAEVAGGEPPRPERLVPAADEISDHHEGRLPAADLAMYSWAPRVVAIRHFLTDFECAEIVNAAAEHLMPSFIVSGDGAMGKHQVRTSQEVRLRPGLRNIVINAVEHRMAEWSHFPVENGELPLVLRYEKAQSFEQHYDYFIPEKFVMGEGPLEYGGQRIATQLVYLNDDFTGGETRFDFAGVEVIPERGLCTLFHNLLPNHNVDPLTRHTGVAVQTGVKWLLSRWIREISFDERADTIQRDQYKEKQ